MEILHELELLSSGSVDDIELQLAEGRWHGNASCWSVGCKRHVQGNEYSTSPCGAIVGAQKEREKKIKIK